MVRKFPTTPYYPSAFDSRKLSANQSAVPSQYSPVPPPFDPSAHPDIHSVPPEVIEIGIVRASFDSRLPRSFDFFWEDKFNAGISQSNGYTVPPGYMIILRKLIVTAYPIQTNDNLHTWGVDQYGFDGVDNIADAPALRLLVDGSNSTTFPLTLGFRGIPLYDLFSSDIEIPLFTLIAQNQQFTIQIPDVTDDVTTSVLVHYYGNYIYATGRNLVNEVGNPDPLLVERIEDKSR